MEPCVVIMTHLSRQSSHRSGTSHPYRHLEHQALWTIQESMHELNSISFITTVKSPYHKGQPLNEFRLQRGREDDEGCGLPNFSPQPHEVKSIVFRECHVVFFHDIEGGFPSRMTSLAVWGPLGNVSWSFTNGLNEIRHAWSSRHIAFIQPFLQNTVRDCQTTHPRSKKSHWPQEIISNSITLRENPFDSISCLSYNRDCFTKPSPNFLYCIPDTVTSLYNSKLMFSIDLLPEIRLFPTSRMHCRKVFNFDCGDIGVCLEEIEPKWEVSHLCAFKQWFGLNDKKEMNAVWKRRPELEPVPVKSVLLKLQSQMFPQKGNNII